MLPLGAIRPGDWNLPLFFHVLGAMVMVGALVLALAYFWGAGRGHAGDSLRHGFHALALAALPGYLVMRIAAQVIADKEGYDQDPVPDWIGIGFGISDFGLLFLIFATVIAGLGARRVRRAAADGRESEAAASVRTVTALTSVLVLAYVIAIWAMTTKPG